MRSYQSDPVSGARLVGGEMLQWSDLDRGTSPGVSELLLPYLLGGAGARRILTVGPSAGSLFERVPADAEVDVLVRGLQDARQLSAVAQLRPGVTVYCGSLDRFEPEVPYDLVVALNGPGMLVSPDSEGVTHREMLKRFASWLTPTGSVLAVLENDLGFARLFRLEVRLGYDSDAAWDRGAAGFDERPLYYRELGDVLGSADLSARAVYAAFPSADKVAVLVGPECVQDRALAQTAAAVAARSEAAHFSAAPALLDVADLALRLFESGQVLPLASAWVVVASPTAADVHAATGTSVEGFPVLLSAEDFARPEWRAVRAVSGAEGSWTSRLTPLVPAAEMRERRVVRDFSGLLDVALTGGPTLESALRRACEGQDVHRVRELVVRYARWLLTLPAQDGEDHRFFAVPANVLVTDEGHTLFDPTWRLTERLPDEVLLVRGVRDFARRLLRSGAEHPWAPDISPDRLAQTLAAMAGVQVPPGAIDTVARVEAEVEVVLHGGNAVGESMAYAHNIDAGRSQFVSQSGPARGYREALATGGRLAQALDDRENQVEWLEVTLRARDRRVGDLEHQLGSTRESVSFKIGRVVTWPAREAVHLVRRVILSAVPPGYFSRAMALVRRLSERV